MGQERRARSVTSPLPSFAEQVTDLIDHGVEELRFTTMNRADLVGSEAADVMAMRIISG